MSEFIDKLKQVSQAEPQSMGFRALSKVSPLPKMLLVAGLAEAKTVGVADYVAGADAALLSVTNLSAGAKKIQQVSKVMADIPCGGWLRGTSGGEIKQIVKAGCDFVVFPASSTPLSIFQDDEIGKILQVEASLSDGLLRTIEGLDVDAVLVTNEDEKSSLLTWYHLMLFRRFAGSLSKPLLVSIPAAVTAKELQALWDNGVDGVLVELEAGQPSGVVKDLRGKIDGLTLPASRKRRKTEALLPFIKSGMEMPAEEGEEEEEEEE